MTASTLTFSGRLPGVECNPALPTGAGPIRLDVAAFVGFAERGPLDRPIAVEDINQYRAVFGGDVVLATDGGTPVYANLPGAAQAFFDNGGRRCYVVRVAGRSTDSQGRNVSAARPARWLLPGLRRWQPDGVVRGVYLDAAWPGRWSDGFGVGTQLLSQPMAVTAPYLRARPGQAGRPAMAGELSLGAASMVLLSPGDLLRLDLGPSRPGLYVTVAAVDRVRNIAKIGAEVAFLTGPASPSHPAEELLLGPEAVTALPPETQLRGAWRLQLNVIAREIVAGATQLLETWTELNFNPGGPNRSWLDVVQPADDHSPDQSRSMIMRADGAAAEQAGDGGLYLPVGMDQLGLDAEFADAVIGPSGETGTVAGSDGLESYDAGAMFLDERLLGTTVHSLLPDAEALTAVGEPATGLRGIHSLLGLDEVALLSVPDAVHRGWSPAAAVPPAAPPAPPVQPPPPDWSDFRECAAVPPAGPAPDALQVSSDPSPQPYPVLDDPAGYQLDDLVDVHTAVVQLCAARSDVFAVLGVPRHFDTADDLAWLQALADNSRDSQAGRTVMSPLSFAGYWHPWVRVIETTSPSLAPLREQPADGSVCGMIAARELARGVWVAPANVPLRGLVGLGRRLSATDTATLFDQHANLLRTQPGAISCLSAHTLSGDPALLQVSVRRLIMLLRKVALREGSRYVFDVNTDRFRQLLRSRFQRILAELTRRGALAAFGVSTDDGINAGDDMANGRLIVTLQVAPTSPIEFISIALVRAGEGLLDVVVG